jgi:hypothetical protein
MGYYSEDVAYFVRTSPYLTLAKPHSATSFLLRQVEAAEECLLTLRAYPDIFVEPLSFLYTCLRSLGALVQAFFEALVHDHTWRGVVWGAWLAMLEPRAEFGDALHSARPTCSKNEWLVDCALSTITGQAPGAEYEPILALAQRYRRCLDGVSRPAVRLRSEPTAAEVTQMEWERARIRSVYAKAGADAALRCLPGTLVGFYAMDYVRWVRSCPSRSALPNAAQQPDGA